MEEKKILCPFCKDHQMIFENDQFQKINSHIKEHQEIDFKDRRKFLESVKKKITSVGPIFIKKFRKEKRANAIKKKRDRKFVLYQKKVLSAVNDCGITKKDYKNIEKIRSVEGINKYLFKELKSFHKELIKKELWFHPNKKKPKNQTTGKPIRIIYTPMGNKR